MHRDPDPDSLLATWSHSSGRDRCVLILPDGCRDLIVRMSPGRSPHWFLSPLMDTVHQAQCRAADTYVGYRMRPGVAIDETKLLIALKGMDGWELTDVFGLIASYCRIDYRLNEALDCLAKADNVVSAARELGVSERSLERLVVRGSHRSPVYWRRLARARRTATTLSARDSLAAVAHDHGYADQAHMSREFSRWFGVPPDRLRRDPALMELVRQSGFG